MSLDINKLLRFQIFNLGLLLLFDSIYDWSSRYLFLTLIAIISPNLIGFLLNLLFSFLYNGKNRRLLQIITFFITNELAFGFYEKRIILFGLIRPRLLHDIIQPDQSHYLFISVASIFAAIWATSNYAKQN